MYKIKELPQDIYVASQGNFGYIRRGDHIAILAFLQSLRFQYKKNLKFYIEPNPHIKDIASEFLHTFINKKDAHVKVPFHGNIWAYYDYIHKFLDVRLRIPNNYKSLVFEKRKIIINPIFDAGYNRDRNWNRPFFTELVSKLATTYIDSEIIVTGTKKMLGQLTRLPNICYVLDDLNESMREICKSDVYIGGDTGLTHFASTSDKKPSLIIGLYGCRSEWRHNEQCQPNVDSILKEYVAIPNAETNRPFLQVNFSPKVPKSKNLIYLFLEKDGSLNQNNLNQIIHECGPHRPTDPDPIVPSHDRLEVSAVLKDNIPTQDSLTIVEVGCLRIGNQSTAQLLAALVNTKKGIYYSVTPSYRSKLTTTEDLKKYHLYSDDVYLVVEDGSVFLTNWTLNIKKSIDIFSVSSENPDGILNVALPLLRKGSLLLINFSSLEKAKNFSLPENFESLHSKGIQLLFRKAE